MRKKKIFFFFGGFLAFVLVAIALLPSFFSTNIGKQILLSFVSRHLPGKVEIESLDLGWSGEQKIQGLFYQTTDNNFQISCPHISCSSGLWRYLFFSDLGTVHVQAPVIEIHQTNISLPLPAKPQVQAASFLGSLPLNTLLPPISISKTCNFQIEHGKASIFSEKNPSIVLDALTGHILAQKKSLSAKIQGTTLQKDLQGTFFIEANWALDTSLEVQTTFSHFPVEGADALLFTTNPQYLGYLTDAIGPFLNLNCHIKIAKEECHASLQAQSTHIQADIQTKWQDSALTLSSPASLQVTLSSNFLQRMQKMHPSFQTIPLKDPFAISIALDQLHIPKTETGIKIAQASFDGRIDTKPYLLSDLTLGCKGRFSSANLSEEISAQMDLLIQKKKESSNSYLKVAFKRPLTTNRQTAASLHIGKTPTYFLQDLFPQASIATDILGSYIEIEGALQNENFSATVHSEFLQIPKVHFLWEDNNLSLQGPTQISYLLTPIFLNRLTSSPSLALQNPTPIEMTISSLQYSDLQNVKMQAKASISSLVFTKFFSLQNYVINDLSCQFDIQSLSKISLQVTSDPFDFAFIGGVDLSNNLLFWEKPLQLRYTLSNQEMELLYLRAEHPKLTKKTPCYLQIDPGSFSWFEPSLDQMKLTTHLQIPSLSLQSRSNKEQVIIQNVQGSCKLFGDQHTAKISLSSKIDEGSLACEAVLQRIFLKDPTINAHLKVQQFPLQLVNTVLPSVIPLPPFLGPSLDASLQIETNSQAKKCWIEGKSQLLQIAGGITIDSQGIFLTKAKTPLQIDLSLTPQGYELLAKHTNKPFHLEKNAHIKASVSKLTLPFLSKTSKVPDLKRLLIQMSIENQEISFQHKETKKNLRLQNTQISLQKKDEKTPLILQLDTFSEGSQKGSLHIDAVCKQLVNPQGNFQLSHMQSDLSASFQTFPSEALDIVFPSKAKQKDPFASLLGSSFTLLLKTSLQNGAGPITLNLQSPNMQFSLDGTLKAGALRLNQNAWAQCKITPETSKVLLQGVNPLSISSLSSETPITLEISSQGFSFPIAPFAYKYIQIPQGRISLGKLWCRNEGNVNLMLGLLKAQQASKKEQLALWFAPLDFHVRQGVVQIERTEILIADVYDVALWGKVDLPENRVNMNLGLTASCLKAAMNIKKLPSDYVLHIPLTGTLSQVELNKKVATSKIVALTLWQNKDLAGKAVGGGIGGALVGGLLDQVLTPPGNDSPTPPAKHPFPWEAYK